MVGKTWENHLCSLMSSTMCCHVAVEEGTTLHLRREELVSEGLIDDLGPQLS